MADEPYFAEVLEAVGAKGYPNADIATDSRLRATNEEIEQLI